MRFPVWMVLVALLSPALRAVDNDYEIAYQESDADSPEMGMFDLAYFLKGQAVRTEMKIPNKEPMIFLYKPGPPELDVVLIPSLKSYAEIPKEDTHESVVFSESAGPVDLKKPLGPVRKYAGVECEEVTEKMDDGRSLTVCINRHLAELQERLSEKNKASYLRGTEPNRRGLLVNMEVKALGKSGAVMFFQRLKTLKKRTLDDSAFEIPKGYRKIDHKDLPPFPLK